MKRFIHAWLPPLITGVLAAVLLVNLGQSAWYFARLHWQTITFPYVVDYGEGPLLDQAVRLSRGENIYPPDLTQYPYRIANYPPLFPAIEAGFVRLAGPAFWYGRAISSLAVLLGAVCIGLILFTLTRSVLAGLVGGLLLLAIPYTLFWGTLNRVDSLALGLSLAALLCAVRSGHRRAGRIATALLLTAAIFTRQSAALAAPLAAFAWLLSQAPRRQGFMRAIELALWTGGFTAALFGLLMVLTRGGFYTHIVTANVNPFYWNTVKNNLNTIIDHLPVLVLCSLGLLGLGWMKPLRSTAWGLAAPYLVGATLAGMTIGKTGSNINYLMELAAAYSLAAGAVVAWSKPRRWVHALVLLALALQAYGIFTWTQADRQGWAQERFVQTADLERMLELARQADGPVLADEYMGIVPLAGKELVFQPFEFKQMVDVGVWDEGPFLEMIRQKKFALIILYQPKTWDSRKERWTPAQLQAIEENYTPAAWVAEAVAYRPR